MHQKLLSIQEAVKLSPVNILYLGSETEIVEEIRPLMSFIENPDLLEFTCFTDASDLLRHLYTWPIEQTETPIVIFGLLRFMQLSKSASNESLARLWIALFNSGLPLQFGDTSHSPVVDGLLSLVGRDETSHEIK